MKFEEELVQPDGESPLSAPDRIIKRRKKRSSAWELVNVKDGTTYCLQCGIVLSITSTTNFERHYIRHHKETWKRWKDKRLYLQNLEKAKDNDLFDCHLIETVQSFPALYTLGIADADMQKTIWTQIADRVNHRGFNSSADSCQCRWNMLKNLFITEHAKKLSHPSFEPAWPLYTTMSFLEPYVEESFGDSSAITSSNIDVAMFTAAGPSSLDDNLVSTSANNDFSQLASTSFQGVQLTSSLENGDSRCYESGISGVLSKKRLSSETEEVRKLLDNSGPMSASVLQQPVSSCGFRHEGNIVTSPGSREGHLLSMLTGLTQTLSETENKELFDSLVLHACEKYAEICRNRKEPQQS